MKTFFTAVVITAGMMGMSANAAEESTLGMSNRMKNRAGAYLGLIGDPFPTLAGVNVGYNFFDFFRATAGLGQMSTTIGSFSASATTIGAGGRFFVPGWNLSPVAGLSAAFVSISQSGGTSLSVNGFNQSGFHIYGTIGVDWQTASGFNLGVGYNLSFAPGVGGLPYLNLGWYSDFI